MRGLFRDRYADFWSWHFHETLVREHNDTLCYTVTRLALQSAGLVRKATLRGKHRKKRERHPLPGMLLFQDGSTHCWLPGTEAKQDLIVTLDDAIGHIMSIFLTAEKGTMSSFQGLTETIRRHGLFSAFYTNRGSHYFLTQETGGKVDKTNLTQVGRALAQLGIRHIPSYSPEARGRMERAFGTLQGRIPQELRVRGHATAEAANVYLRDAFMADFNARFGVAASDAGSAYIAYGGAALEEHALPAGRPSGWRATTTYPGRAKLCRSRNRRIVTTMSAQPYGCTNTLMPAWLCSTDRAAWPVTTATANSSNRPCRGPHERDIDHQPTARHPWICA